MRLERICWAWLMSLTTPITFNDTFRLLTASLEIQADRPGTEAIVIYRQKVPVRLFLPVLIKERCTFAHMCIKFLQHWQKMATHPAQFFIGFDIRIFTYILLQISMQSIYILCVVELEKCTQFTELHNHNYTCSRYLERVARVELMVLYSG